MTKCDKHIGYLPSADCFEQGQARVEVVCSYQVDIYCQQNSTLLKDLKNLNSHVWSCILIVFNSSRNKPRWVFLKRNCVLLFLTYPYMLPSLNSTILIGDPYWWRCVTNLPKPCCSRRSMDVGAVCRTWSLWKSESMGTGWTVQNHQGLLLATFWCCKWHMFLYNIKFMRWMVRFLILMVFHTG